MERDHRQATLAGVGSPDSEMISAVQHHPAVLFANTGAYEPAKPPLPSLLEPESPVRIDGP